MTPEDVASIRADLTGYSKGVTTASLLALCDALEVAWAERDELILSSEAAWRDRVAIAESVKHWRERAARTEADVESLQRQNDKLDEALARVRELCDTDDCYADWSWGDLARAMTEIRADVEGP